MKKLCYVIIYVILISVLVKAFFYESYATDVDLDRFVYGDGLSKTDLFKGNTLFETKNNTSELYEYSVKGSSNINDGKYDAVNTKIGNGDRYMVRYNWLHAVHSIVNLVNTNGYRNIVSNTNVISGAIKGLEMARREIGSFIGGDEEITDGTTKISFRMWVPGLGVVGESDNKSEVMPSMIRSSNAFKNIIDPSMPSFVSSDYIDNSKIKEQVDEIFTNYDKKIYTAIQTLHAALDYNKKNGSKSGIYIEDGYKTKFLYTLSNIRTYDSYYSMKNMGDNISTTEQEQLKRAWGAKAAAKAAGYPNIETSQDIYVRKKDDKSTKLNYNKDQIWMYLQIFSPNTSGFLGISEKSDADEIAVKWANKLSGTNNYNTTDPQKISSAYGYLRGIQNVVNPGLEAINNSTDAVIDITSTVKTDAEGEAAAAAADSKAHKIYAEKYTLPEKIGSNNGDTDATDLDTIIDSADSFISSGEDNKISEDNLKNLSDSIYSILLVVGIIVAVIIGSILGIRFMTGSVEQQADVKKLLVPYIAGCVVVFGAFGIWKIAVTILASI